MFRTIAHACALTSVSFIALAASANGAAANGAPATLGYSNAVVFCLPGQCSDGGIPISALIADKSGNLYGTTYGGGTYNDGTVFKVAPDGTETVLYSFCSQAHCADGQGPGNGTLYMDKAGNLYGTTEAGGSGVGAAGGTVFKLAPDGTETVLYSFCSQGGESCTDGLTPLAGVIGDKAGNLYGTTNTDGPYGHGEVYKLSPDGTLTVLWGFCVDYGCTDGEEPGQGNLIMDALGNLYDTTIYGGAGGAGALYEIAPGGGLTVLYSFCPKTNCTDGSHPYGGVVMDRNGNLYGTTATGGAYWDASTGGGTAYMLSPTSGTETVLHSFGNGSDGANPYGGVTLAGKGPTVYGTTLQGANAGCNNGCGIAFSLVRRNGTYTENILHAFYQAEDGDAGQPVSGVIHSNGYLYGTAQLGGGGSQNAEGVLFKLGTKGGVVR